MSANSKSRVSVVDGKVQIKSTNSTKQSKGAKMETQSKVMFNLTGAAQYLNVDPHFLRKLVQEGKIPSTKENVPGTKIIRYMISQEALDVRKAEMAARRPIHLPDGYRKYIYRGPVTAIETICKEHPEFAQYFELANPTKENQQ